MSKKKIHTFVTHDKVEIWQKVVHEVPGDSRKEAESLLNQSSSEYACDYEPLYDTEEFLERDETETIYHGFAWEEVDDE